MLFYKTKIIIASWLAKPSMIWFAQILRQRYHGTVIMVRFKKLH